MWYNGDSLKFLKTKKNWIDVTVNTYMYVNIIYVQNMQKDIQKFVYSSKNYS